MGNPRREGSASAEWLGPPIACGDKTGALVRLRQTLPIEAVEQARDLERSEMMVRRIYLKNLGSETVSPIIFGPEKAEAILGVVALESTGIGVDPVTNTLKRMPAIPLK